MSLAIDHLVLCVQDIRLAAEELAVRGIESVQGGRHRGHGTANRIVPLGDSYLELVAVVNSDEADGSPFGSWVSQRARQGSAVDAVCLRSDDLDDVCGRLDLEATAMSRIRPDGVELRWRLAGLEEALTRSLPFFIEWDVADEMLPGRTPISHPAGPITLGRVTMSGDPAVLGSWVGEAEAILVDSGESGSIAAEMITSAGVLTL